MNFFKTTPVASQELLLKARELYESPVRTRFNLEIGIQFPLSQLVEPTEPRINSQFYGGQYEERVPLVLLSAFPRGRLLVGFFDDEDAKNHEELINFLRAQSINVIRVKTYSAIDCDVLYGAIDKSKGIQKEFARHPVGYRHSEALAIFRNREQYLGTHNPFMTLNEVSCSSVGRLTPEGVWSNSESREHRIWSYIRKTSFDILVFEKVSLEPVLAIEYDGEHHKDDEQRAKDVLKNEFCAALSLPLVRVDERFISPPDEVDLSSSSYQTYELLKTRFRQGVLIRLLGYARRQLLKHKEFKAVLSKHQKSGLEGLDLVHATFEETAESDVLWEMMERDDRRDLVDQYIKTFNQEPDVSYHELGESRIQGQLRWDKYKLKTPCGISLQAFGLSDLSLEKMTRDYIFEWLLETRLQSHYQDSSRPRRS